VALGQGMHHCATYLGKQLVLVPPSGEVVAPSQEAAARCVAAPEGHCNPFGLHGAPHDAAIVRSACRVSSLLVSVSGTFSLLSASCDKSGLAVTGVPTVCAIAVNEHLVRVCRVCEGPQRPPQGAKPLVLGSQGVQVARLSTLQQRLPPPLRHYMHQTVQGAS
jgi:hypothetical protein